MKPTPSPFSSRILEQSADLCVLRIRDLIQDEGGIFQSHARLEHLEYHCRKRMQKIGVNTLDSYWEILTTAPSGQVELGKLLQELKCQRSFFRKPFPA
jgi:hypothetical protein